MRSPEEGHRGCCDGGRPDWCETWQAGGLVVYEGDAGGHGHRIRLWACKWEVCVVPSTQPWLGIQCLSEEGATEYAGHRFAGS